MTREETAAKISEIIRDCLPDFAETVFTDDTRINTEMDMDSMTFVYVMCRIEAEFDVRIPHGRWRKMITFGDTVNAVYEAVSKKK